MKIYSYHRMTSEFISDGQAQVDQLETLRHYQETGENELQFLVPANATTIAPPTTGDNEVATFDGEAWNIEVDHRGKEVFSVETQAPQTIEALGEIPEGHTTESPAGEFDTWTGDAWATDYTKRAAALKPHFKNAIDLAAGRARSRFISPGEAVEKEYDRAYSESLRYLSEGGDVPLSVQTYADVIGETPDVAAQGIITIGERWLVLLDVIRDIRLKGKGAIDSADDAADFEAVAEMFIDQLDLLKPV